MANICRPGLPAELPAPDCVPNLNAPSIDTWYDGELELPFLNPRTCEISIVVDRTLDGSQFESLGPTPQERLGRYFEYGVEKFIEFYRKQIGAEKRETYIGLAGDMYHQASSVNPPEVRYHIDPRPGSKVLVLVTLPLYHRDPEVPLFQKEPDRVYTPAYDTRNTISVRYDVRLMAAKIEFVAKIIKDHYGKTHGNPLGELAQHLETQARAQVDLTLRHQTGGQITLEDDPVDRGYLDLEPVRNLNLKVQAGRLSKSLNYIQQLLDYNLIGVDLKSVLTTRAEYIELIFKKPNQITRAVAEREGRNDTIVRQVLPYGDYELLDVGYIHQDGSAKYLRAGFNRVTLPLTQTTAGLMYWTGTELFQLFNNHINPSWENFVIKYIFPPHDMNMAIGQGLMRSGLMPDLSAITNGFAMAGMFMDWIGLGGDLCGGNLMPLLGGQAKSWAMLQIENDDIMSTAFRDSLDALTFNVDRNIDTPFNTCSDLSRGGTDILNNTLSALQAAYETLFDHIDLRYLTGKLALCIGTSIDPGFLASLENLIELLRSLPSLWFTTFDFSSIWSPYELISDITSFLIGLAVDIITGIIVSLIQQGVMYLLDQLDRLCEEDFDYESVNLDHLISDALGNAEGDFYRSMSSIMGDSTGLLKELIRDVSAVMGIKELCSLLQGTASTSLLRATRKIIITPKYVSFHNKFRTIEDVSRFFASLGLMLSPTICEFADLVPGELCEDGFYETVRRNLLSEKEGITPGQIEDQISSARKRRDAVMSQIDEIFNMTEKSMDEKLAMLLKNNVEINRLIASHHSTKFAIDNMVQTTFITSIVTMAYEGLGTLTTPYLMVLARENPSSPKLPISFNTNRGIMGILIDRSGHKAFRTGRLSDSLYPEGTGIADQLSWFNMNSMATPIQGHRLIDVFQDSERWSYDALLYPLIGRYSRFTANLDSAKRANVKPISFEIQPGQHQVWWDSSYKNNVDLPKLSIAFIGRAPLAGFPNRGEIDERWKQPGPVLNGFNMGPAVVPDDFDDWIQPDLDILDRSVSPHDEFIYALRPTNPLLRTRPELKIDVFNDVPKVIEEGLVPDKSLYVMSPRGTSQQIAYANLLLTQVREQFSPDAQEGMLDISDDNPRYFDRGFPIPDPDPGLGSLNDIEEGTPLNARLGFENLAKHSYESTFSDVMRILYRFATDSEFYFVPAEMTSNLERKFKNQREITKLFGIEDLQSVIEQNIVDVLTHSDKESEAITDMLGESALRFMIRPYILEIFLKNLFMFSSSPGLRHTQGKTVLNDAPATEDISELFSAPPPLLPGGIQQLREIMDPRSEYRVPDPSGYTSQVTDRIKHIPIEIPRGTHFHTSLDLKDIVDPIMVKYIHEYMRFSNDKTPEEDRCESYYDLALRLVEKELEQSGEEELSVAARVKVSTMPERAYYNDTLAYFPPKDPSKISPASAALEFYIAKELKAFLTTYQEFLELKDYQRGGTPWPQPHDGSNTKKQSLIESFLDKFEVIGYNIRSQMNSETGAMQYGSEYFIPDPERPDHGTLKDWRDLGEGLYMELYATHPNPLTEITFLDMEEIGALEDEDRVGLRMCLRDSKYHRNGDLGDNPDSFYQLFEDYFDLANTTMRRGKKTWDRKKGFPILEVEETWGTVKREVLGLSSADSSSPHFNRPQLDFSSRRKIFDYLKNKMVLSDDFRVMFEYIFPVKKMFNYLMILMDINVSAQLTNTDLRGVLPASCIDPEQFVKGKGVAKGIIEAVYNSDNYAHKGSSGSEKAGGSARLALGKMLNDL